MKNTRRFLFGSYSFEQEYAFKKLREKLRDEFIRSANTPYHEANKKEIN
jgi:hypothetical protein